jgi:hypothetical protein
VAATIGAGAAGWTIGRLLGDLGMDRLMEHLSQSDLDKIDKAATHKATERVRRLYANAKERGLSPADELQREANLQRGVDDSRAALHGDVHIHGDVHVQTDNAKGLADELRLAANRSSGSSSTSPTHSPSSGYGGAGGP